MLVACLALETFSARNVRLHRHPVAFLHRVDLASHLDYIAAYLMAEDHRRLDAVLGILGPIVDVDIGAAYGSRFHLDDYVLRPRPRVLNIDIARARRRGLLHNSFHD